MAILPVDLQALLMRMNEASKPHQREYEGVVLTQMTKAEEISRAAQIESSRVNQVKPHPEQNTRIEEAAREKKVKGRGHKKGGKGRAAPGHRVPPLKLPDFDDPYKGSVIDTKR